MLQTAFTKALNVVLLQGHQNVGELRLRNVAPIINLLYCRVTRMLVSYDGTVNGDWKIMLLQGHQNVGELRPSSKSIENSFLDCRVTRMLVSYDYLPHPYRIAGMNCRVTRMLVSYDLFYLI